MAVRSVVVDDIRWRDWDRTSMRSCDSVTIMFMLVAAAEEVRCWLPEPPPMLEAAVVAVATVAMFIYILRSSYNKLPRGSKGSKK